MKGGGSPNQSLFYENPEVLNDEPHPGGEGGEGLGEESRHDPRGQAEELHVPRGKSLLLLDAEKGL